VKFKVQANVSADGGEDTETLVTVPADVPDNIPT